MKRPLVLVILLLAIVNWQPAMAKKPVFTGDPRAVKGGQITVATSDFPKSFNYYVATSTDASLVFGLNYETLAALDPITLEYHPLLAESWTISKDKRTFTFRINNKARWVDDTPVTVDDVKFTYDTIMNPDNLTSVQRIFLSRFESPTILDSKTIQFRAKNVHYNNFVTLASLNILPKKSFYGKDFNKDFTIHLPAGSGPYFLSEVKEGRYYTLKRRPDYWGKDLLINVGAYNFDLIKFRVISNDDMAFEAFKKGDFDLFVEGSAKRWVMHSESEKFNMNWLVKQKIFNYEPQGFSGMALNMRRPVFKDVRVRKAVSLLLNRKVLLEKLMFGEYTPLRSYWPSLNIDPKMNSAVDFDPRQAQRLLVQAGYERVDREGYRINTDGRRLEFNILYVSDAFERHLTIYKEDLRKAGVKANLRLVSWATLLRLMDDYNYDAVIIAWSASLFPDPEQLWHSRHMNEPAGSNLPGYSNPKVDRMIESLPSIFDAKKREAIIRAIDAEITQDYPYVLFWGANFSRIYYRNVFSMPETVFSRLGNWSDALVYWWYDPEKALLLKEAQKNGKPLPAVPVNIYYDNALRP
jgi:microcin C transport system substrate-binding protein